MTSRLIGVTGYARAGKDTIGRILVERHGFQRVSFADKLRQVALAVDPFVCIHPEADEGTSTIWARLTEVVEAWGWERAKEHEDVRRLLQRLGTEGGRNILGENVWVDAALRDLEPGGSYVFTDVRFPNEANAIQARGGRVWRVTRPGFRPINAHPSETALDNFQPDHTISNGGDVEGLAHLVGKALGAPPCDHMDCFIRDCARWGCAKLKERAAI